MIKIDFENLTVYTNIERTCKIIVNERKDFADTMYRNGQGLPFHALALKIYNSHGETEYSDEEYELIKKVAEAFYTPCFIDSIRACSDSNK
jgi:anaerobic ribonucleoside-triphosphate reductase